MTPFSPFLSPGYLQVVCPPAAPALLAGAGLVGDWSWNWPETVDVGFSGLATFLEPCGGLHLG